MLKRLLMVALLLALPLAAAGLHSTPQASANTTTGWDPSTDAGVDAIPDRDNSSARFLILSGPNNSTLTGDVSGPGETYVSVTFSPTISAGPIRIAIFDPNSVGLWDQRVDGRLLTVAPNVRYRLYADPAGDALSRIQDADATNDPLVVNERDAVTHYNSDPASDSAWCDFYNSTAGSNAAAATSAGTYRFLMRSTLEAAPGQLFLQGPERAGHKFAFNGTYLLPAGTIIGFAGGAVDERTIIGTENQLLHNTQDPTTYLDTNDPKFISDNPAVGDQWFFNGIFDFRFLNTQACRGDIVMQEADADFQTDTRQGQSQFDPLLNPTGIPPDNVPFYRLPGNDPFPFREVQDFIILSHKDGGSTIPVRWRVFPITNEHATPPNGDLTPIAPAFSSESSTTAGHASFDINIQAPNLGDDPFQSATFDSATVLATPGPWCIRWESIDKANFIFMKFNVDIGTTPISPQINGNVFCDANANGERDSNETDGLQATLSLTRVDCVDNSTVIATLPNIVTAADGSFTVSDLAAGGCYRLDAVSPSPFPPLTVGQLPMVITVPADTCFATVEIPVRCELQICGWAFCSTDGNCTYDPNAAVNPDLPLPAGSTVTVTLQPLNANGQPEGAPVTLTVDSTNPRWCFENLLPGRYRVTCASQDVTPVPGCVLTTDIELSFANAQNDEVLEIACPFICEQEACAILYCDDNENGVLDATDRLMSGVQVTATLGNTVRTSNTDANGKVCFDLAAGTWTFKVNPPFPLGAEILSDSRSVTVVTGQDTPDTVFAFTCTDEACVRLFCDDNNNGVFDAGERGMPGIVVNATLGQSTETGTTDANGRVCYDLIPGTWTLTAVEPVGGWPNSGELINGNTTTVTVVSGVTPAEAAITFRCEDEACVRLFCDDNNNGAFDAGERGMPGIVVTATLGQNTETGTTDASGRVCFDLTPGTWTLAATQPAAGWPNSGVLINGNTTTITVVSGQTPSDAAITFRCEEEACVRLFCDDNSNGTFEAGERGMAGIVVNATLGQNTETGTTDASGRVCFDLIPGTWTLTATEPAAGWPNNGVAINGNATTVTVVAGTPTPDAAITFRCEEEACVRLFCDDNGNGTFEAGERGMAGIVVNAAQGTNTKTGTTDASGRVCFDLIPGSWTLTATQPVAGWPNSGVLINGNTTTITVVAGTPTPDAAITFRCEEEACVLLFCDDNANGRFDGTDRPLGGIAVSATLGADTKNGFTDVNGRACFDLTPGTWTLAATEPATGWPEGGVPINGTSVTVTVVTGQAPAASAITFRCEDEACVRLFCDDNNNGVFDGTDIPFPGITVTASRDQTTLTGTTDAQGKYCFDLTPGAWQFAAVEPAGGWPNGGQPVAGLTADIVVIPGTGAPEAAIRFTCEEEVCVRLFCDENENGVYDAGIDIPFAGIGLGAAQGNLPAISATTDAAGQHCFKLTAGEWVITATEPAAGWPNGGVPLVPTQATVTVVAGQLNAEVAISFRCEEEACVRLFCDDNNNGIFDGTDIPLVGIEVTATLGNETKTGTSDTNGEVCFDLKSGDWTLTAVEPVSGWPNGGVPIAGTSRPITVVAGTPTPATSITFRCEEEVTARLFCDENNNGVFDGTDIPFANIEVRASNGTTTITGTTDATGLVTMDLPAGNWTLTAVQPAAGWPNNGIPANGLSRDIVVVAGQNTPETPVAFICPRDVCVIAYCDDNQNGRLDATDRLLENITMVLTTTEGVLSAPTGADGKFTFPNIYPGTAFARVSGPFPAGIVPQSLASQEVTIVHGQDPACVEFAFDCLGSIFGRVVIEDAPWDGVISDGEAIEAIANITVTLSGNTAAGPVNRTFITGPNGSYNFNDLPAGTYTVSVDGTQIANLNLSPSPNSPQSVPTTLLPGGTAEIDFTNCPPGKIVGYAFEDPRKDCDGVYAPGEGLAGILINLIQNGQVIDSTTTNADGFYEFINLQPGNFDVMVVTPNPNTRNLTIITPDNRSVVVTAGGEARADFGYATQGLTGRVWRDEECDATFGSQDAALSNILITIVGIGGDANGYTDTQSTGANGTYSFQDIPEGRYEVTVDTQSPTVVDLELQGDATQSPLVPICDNGKADFSFCQICDDKDQCACIRVYREPRGKGDGVYTDGVDTWLEGAQVFLKRKDDTSGYLEWKYTDANGKACFDGLESGVEYRIYLGANQVGLPDCPDNVFCDIEPKCVKDSEDCIECVVGYEEPCPKIACCEGTTREVEVRTEVWCGHAAGDEDICVDLKATLFNGCGPNANAMDTVSMEFCNAFPGSKTGLDGIVSVTNVELTPWGTAWVSLKVDAAALNAGHFGDGEYRLDVTVNGDTSTGCTKLRCENVRRGSWFTYSEKCGDMPPCDGDVYDLSPYVPMDPECMARFQVMEVLSSKAWEACEGGPSCDPMGPMPVTMTYNVPCKFQKDTKLRHAEVKVLLNGQEGVADSVEVLFEGDKWTGSKTSPAGCVTITKVYKVGEENGKCIWKVDATVNRPCCITGEDTDGDGTRDGLLKARLCSTVDWVFSTDDPEVEVCAVK